MSIKWPKVGKDVPLDEKTVKKINVRVFAYNKKLNIIKEEMWSGIYADLGLTEEEGDSVDLDVQTNPCCPMRLVYRGPVR